MNHYDVPMDLKSMKIYLAHPQHNPRTQKIVFYTEFLTTVSIIDLKRDSGYWFQWLKDHKVHICLMAIKTMAK